MPAVELTVQEIVRTGLKPTYTAMTADGVVFANDETVFLFAKNAAANPATVTITTAATYSGLALADLTVSIPAGEERMIGPFPRKDFNDTGGKITVSTNTITTTTIAAIKL